MTVTRAGRITTWAWTTILFLIGGFQLYRGAIPDGVVFLVLALALVLDNVGWMPRFREWPRRVSRLLVLIAVSAAAIVLAVTPRHGLPDEIALVVSGVIVLLVVWPGRPTENPAMTRRIARTAILWAAIGIAVCLWELAMYFLGTYAAGGRGSYPALSDLLDPLVQNPIGRVIFVAAWLLGGVALTRRGRRQ